MDKKVIIIIIEDEICTSVWTNVVLVPIGYLGGKVELLEGIGNPVKGSHSLVHHHTQQSFGVGEHRDPQARDSLSTLQILYIAILVNNCALFRKIITLTSID